ncbi:hypothetical protein OF83DRAFT_1178198 [Amylostereum chailletii]|nr:hypothetical protein OF83DRAFT_1178198 [Amylostereum chailletii]
MSSEEDLKEIGPRQEAERYWLTRLGVQLKNVTASSDGATVSKALQTIQQEMEAMQAAICAVNTRRNTLIPIARLSADVLAIIFSFAVINETPTWNEKPRPYSPSMGSKLGWIKVSHVSRHWRHTALAYPSLWSIVSFQGSNLRWTHEMLARSKAAPLTIIRATRPLNLKTLFNFTGTGPIVERVGDFSKDMLERESWDPIVARLAQIEHLLVGNAVKDLLIVIKVISRRAPCLRALDISTPLVEVPGPLGHSNHMTMLFPPVLFDNDAPNLRSLKLYGCHVRWSSIVFPSLTHLEIGLPKMQRSQGMSLLMAFDPTDEMFIKNGPPDTSEYFLPGCDTFLKALHQMSGLESLILHNIISSPAPTDDAPATISLPNLHKLAVEDKRPETCAWVLDRLQVPEICTIYIESGHGEHNGLEGYEELLPFLSAHVAKRSSASSPLRTISVSDDRGLDIKIWDDCNDVDITRLFPKFEPTSEPILRLSFSWPTQDVEDYPLERLDALKIFCLHLPLEDLRTIVVEDYHDPYWLSSDWIDIFDRSLNVEHIRATDNAAPCLLRVLGEGNHAPPQTSGTAPTSKKKRKGREQSPKTSEPMPFFSHLKSVVIDDADLSRNCQVPGRELASYATHLQHWLTKRHERNAGLQALRLDSCLGVNDALVGEYRKSVPTVIWEKEESSDFEDEDEDDEDYDDDGEE